MSWFDNSWHVRNLYKNLPTKCYKCGASCKWGACVECNHKPDKPHESTLVRVFRAVVGGAK